MIDEPTTPPNAAVATQRLAAPADQQAVSTIAVPPGDKTLLHRVFNRDSPVWILLVLVAIVIVFGAKNSNFVDSFNIKSIGVNASIFLVMGVGMTFVIITAGIDLSVGSVLVFAGMCAAKVMEAMNANTSAAGWGVAIVGMLVGIAAGLAWGILQGYLIAYINLPPFIVTLGGYGAALGLAQVLNNGIDLTGVPSGMVNTIGNGSVLGIPWLVVIAVVIAILGGLLLNLTRFGRYTFAVGSNAEGSRRSGIDVKRHLLAVYCLMGLLAGVAGDLSLAHNTSTTIQSHTTDNLTVITAVILGSTSLFGGVGSMFGTVIGTLIPVALDSGLVIAGVQSFWQAVAVGVVLVLAVFADQKRRSRFNR